MTIIRVESMVGSKDGRPYVSLQWLGDPKRAQLSSEEALAFAMNVIQCIGAAEQDAAFLAFLQQKLNMELPNAASVLNDLRQFRDPKKQKGIVTEKEV